MRIPLMLSVIITLLLSATDMAAQSVGEIDLRKHISTQTKLSTESYHITSSHVSRTSGVTHVYFTQVYENIVIANAQSTMHIAPNGQIIKFDNRCIQPKNYKKYTIKDLKRSPREVFEGVLEQLKIKKPKEYKITKSSTESFEIQAPSIAKNRIQADLYWFIQNNELRQVWKMEIQETTKSNWWEILSDAQTGEILQKTNYTLSCDWNSDPSTHSNHQSDKTTVPQPKNLQKTITEPSYQVFPLPLESPHDGSHSLVTNSSDSLASPLGWHDINGQVGPDIYYTRGNNVWSNEDLNGLNGRGNSPHGGPSLLFDAAIDLQDEPIDYLDGAITNLFYWNNIIHDISYQYGFTEEAGNFQDNNYSKGGEAKDFVIADAQDFGNCNANFSTPPDGRNPVMQMYTCNNTTPKRDSDLDNGVIIHEYAHGISNRLIGGPANASCLNNNEQMGEGWSDFYAVMLTMTASDTENDARPMGNYFTGQSINGPGIRPYPYSTDLGINPLTYGDISSLSVPHGVGSLWTTMLWELNWALINAYGYDDDLYNGIGGNNIALQLVTEGLKLTDCLPGFVSGRDAILAADTLMYGGANSCLIWEAFAKRGLGTGADQGDTDNIADGTSNFDMPLNCIHQDSFIINAPTRVQVGCDQTSFTIHISPYNGYNTDVVLTTNGLPAGVMSTFAQNSISPGGTTTLTLSNTTTQNSGSYPFSIIATTTDSEHSVDVVWIKPNSMSIPSISEPANGSDLYVARPKMTWEAVENAMSYEIQIATDAQFNNIVSTDGHLLSTEYYPEVLSANQMHYWRVRAINGCEISDFSSAYSFTISSCGAEFTDDGGALFDHDDMERVNYTICPDANLDTIAIDFSVFDIEEVNASRCWDWLVVYDGFDTSTPPVGEYCNEGLTYAPGQGYIQSTHPSGCLTFEFFSDSYVTEAGWIADIICIPGACEPSAPDMSVTGPDILCSNMADVSYTISAIEEATNYLWTYSGSDVVINNNGSNSITLDFGPNATNGDLSCLLTLPCGDFYYPGMTILVSDNPDCSDNYCMTPNDMVTSAKLASASNPDVFHSIGALQSDGSIVNSKYIVFKAEQNIDLLSGFSIGLGSSLEVAVEDCPN